MTQTGSVAEGRLSDWISLGVLASWVPRDPRSDAEGAPGPSQQPAREPWGRRALYAPLVHDHRAAGRREDDRAQALGAGLYVPGPGRRGRRTRRRGHSQLRLVVHE